eukprot:1376184-Prorocentrum_lima.AAC.1
MSVSSSSSSFGFSISVVRAATHPALVRPLPEEVLARSSLVLVRILRKILSLGGVVALSGGSG